MAESSITVEVIHVDAASRVERRRIRLPAGSTVMQAIVDCGIVAALPAGAIDRDRLAIFGRKVGPDQPVRDGDRVEICRPLALDPKEARRRRVR
jgi:putative ubiquitin-RnfH superfamily antitoxin RatB of RatAB toxin-antitoxin module